MQQERDEDSSEVIIVSPNLATNQLGIAANFFATDA